MHKKYSPHTLSIKITITHKLLQSILNCDQIMVLGKCEIVELGDRESIE
jgi:ABC-type multidrug transport system fused ATPase/permease subunit